MTVVLHNSEQITPSEMFFYWILKSSMVVAIDYLQIHKKHLLSSLYIEACPVWPFLKENFLLIVYKHLLNVKCGQFCIRSNLRWHLEWADPPARFFFQQFETVPRAGHSRSCLQESSGQSQIWTGDLLVQLVKYSAMKVAVSSANHFVVSSQSCADASLGTSWTTQEKICSVQQRHSYCTVIK